MKHPDVARLTDEEIRSIFRTIADWPGPEKESHAETVAVPVLDWTQAGIRGETMNKTSIEWTHRPSTIGMTWNPIHAHWDKKRDQRGNLKTGNFCTKISPGCANCYAERINVARGNGLEYTVTNLRAAKFYLDEKELTAPLRQKKPCTIFVGDMFDLFHEAIPDQLIAQVFDVILGTPKHTYQVLTKRAHRMRELLNLWVPIWAGIPNNVWLGVSVESQKYADERIPLLLQTPAAVRFLSVEPMLEAICMNRGGASYLSPSAFGPGISWVICGGESGPGARPFNLAWAESLLEQCKAAGVPFFMKQIGSNPIWPAPELGGTIFPPVKSKGGDPSEWPAHLRVREFPALEAVPA